MIKSIRAYARMPLVIALAAATALAGCLDASGVAIRADDPCASSLAPFMALRRERQSTDGHLCCFGRSGVRSHCQSR